MVKQHDGVFPEAGKIGAGRQNPEALRIERFVVNRERKRFCHLLLFCFCKGLLLFIL
jgi:hypothetical protein